MHATPMNAVAATISSGTGLYKAVCHKCHYVGFEPNCNRCVHCGFPLILEPYETAPVVLREIFDRSSVELGVNVKAPPLPGVDPQKRKAQLLAEARRKLRSEPASEPSSTAAPVTRPPVSSHMVVVSAAPAASPSFSPSPLAASPSVPMAAYQAVPAAPAAAPVHRSIAPARTMMPAMAPAAAYESLPPASSRMRIGMTLALISVAVASVLAAAMNSGF